VPFATLHGHEALHELEHGAYGSWAAWIPAAMAFRNGQRRWGLTIACLLAARLPVASRSCNGNQPSKTLLQQEIGSSLGPP